MDQEQCMEACVLFFACHFLYADEQVKCEELNEEDRADGVDGKGVKTCKSRRRRSFPDDDDGDDGMYSISLMDGDLSWISEIDSQDDDRLLIQATRAGKMTRHMT
jgi:hypothetical protein